MNRAELQGLVMAEPVTRAYANGVEQVELRVSGGDGTLPLLVNLSVDTLGTDAVGEVEYGDVVRVVGRLVRAWDGDGAGRTATTILADELDIVTPAPVVCDTCGLSLNRLKGEVFLGDDGGVYCNDDFAAGSDW